MELIGICIFTMVFIVSLSLFACVAWYRLQRRKVIARAYARSFVEELDDYEKYSPRSNFEGPGEEEPQIISPNPWTLTVNSPLLSPTPSSHVNVVPSSHSFMSVLDPRWDEADEDIDEDITPSWNPKFQSLTQKLDDEETSRGLLSSPQSQGKGTKNMSFSQRHRLEWSQRRDALLKHFKNK
jgi:hypothetical protein